MGVDWLPWPALTQAVPPAYTLWIGVQLLILLPARAGGVHVGSGSGAGGNRHVAGGETSHLVDGESSLVDRDATPSTIGKRHCRCGRPLPGRPATGRWPRYCSHACRQAAYRARHDTPGQQP
jgi:hypothetical protein